MAKDGLSKVVEREIKDKNNFKSKKEEKKMEIKGILRMVLGMLFVVVLVMGCNSGGDNPAGPSGDAGTVADSGSDSGNPPPSTPPPSTPPPSPPGVPDIVFPESLQFGDISVGNFKLRNLIIRNDQNATADLIINNVRINVGSFSIIGDGCSGTTLEPYGGCIVVVKFEPLAVGSYCSPNDRIEIGSYDPDEGTVKVGLCGRGV